MIKKMEMDEERLREVLGFSCIGLPEEEYAEVLMPGSSAVLRCTICRNSDSSNVSPFEWDVMKAPARREDIPVTWGWRGSLPDQAPVRERRLLPRPADQQDDVEAKRRNRGWNS